VVREAPWSAVPRHRFEAWQIPRSGTHSTAFGLNFGAGNAVRTLRNARSVEDSSQLGTAEAVTVFRVLFSLDMAFNRLYFILNSGGILNKLESFDCRENGRKHDYEWAAFKGLLVIGRGNNYGQETIDIDGSSSLGTGTSNPGNKVRT
jgi:hypothetical protein